jgi:hypothetical protein
MRSSWPLYTAHLGAGARHGRVFGTLELICAGAHEPMLRRIVVVSIGLVVGLALAGCAGHGQAATRAAVRPRADAAFHCPTTLPNGQVPPGESRNASDYGNGRLWTLVPSNGKLVVTMTRPAPPGTVFGEVLRDGSLATKFPWWGARRAGPDLHITGTRLDGPAQPLRATTARGFTRAPHFWASTITFATQGCWQVTGRDRAARLAFVLQVMRG